MASIKVVLRKKKNAKGLYPIVIRITKNRKSSYLSTGQYIEQKYWDEKNQKVRKSHKNSTRLNNFILKKLAEANDKLLELESNQEAITAQVVTKQIKSKDKVTTFFEFANNYLEQLEKDGQFNRVRAEKSRIRQFRKYLKNKDLSFPEVSESLLRKFQGHLKSVRKVTDRTVINYMIVIRTIYNLAIREGIVEKKHYPFGKGGIVIRFPQSVKLGLTKEEVTSLEEIELDIPQEHYARNVWLVSYYFAGIRVSDVLKLKWSDFKDGRLYYQMGKNSKVVSLKIPNKANEILAEYENQKTSKDDFIFPSMKNANLENGSAFSEKIANGNRLINKYLKRIAKKLELDKPLTMHIARHTFGNISGDKIPVQMLQKLYRHSDLTTTINYQKNFIFKDADDALDAVLNS